MYKTALIIACMSACLGVAGPARSQSPDETPKPAAGSETPTEKKVSSAEEIRQMFYEGLVKRGVAAPIAALLTVDTEVVSESSEHLHFVQTLIGGGKREVKLSFKPAGEDQTPRVPLLMDEGQVALAESVTAKPVGEGYQANTAFYLPPESVPFELEQAPKLGQAAPAWLEWIGIGDTHAQAPGSGLAVSVSDGYSSSGSTSMQSVVQAAEQTLNSQAIELLKTAQEVSSMIEPQVEGPKTLLQHRTDQVKAGAEVFEHGSKVWDMLKQDDAMRQKLRALKDCAENPTEPTAIDAQRTDPNYRRATTEAIEDAERNLKLNSTIRIIASTANAIAGVLLSAAGGGPAQAKAVSLLDNLEDKALQHVAEEYIMKDAGKGVVPCRSTCDPVYSPPPPPEQLDNYPPAEMSCSQPDPAALVCQAAPASSGPNSSQPPPPPVTPPPAGTCGVLKRADFTYTYSYSDSGCMPLVCASSRTQIQYRGTATLTPDRTLGYRGRGPGTYQSTEYSEEVVKFACESKHSSSTSVGPADLIVNAYFSINNSVTGGLDTGGMSEDTSVVEIITEGDQIVADQSWVNGCDPRQTLTSMNSVGFDCHFYGVDLYRPGYYRVYKDNDPSSGICTLSLSR